MKIFKNETSKKEDKGKSMKELYADGKSAAVVKKDPKKSTSEKTAAAKPGNAYRILIKPLITEKATIMAVQNKYFFNVADDANKVEIKKAISEVYGVTPVAVNIISVLGKRKRQGRISGKRKDWKKAVVTLPEGKTINLYEGV